MELDLQRKRSKIAHDALSQALISFLYFYKNIKAAN